MWRRDYVLLQEKESTASESGGTLNGRLPGQLLIVVSVADLDQPIGFREGNHQTYTGAWIELLQPKNRGKPHEIHGMIVLKCEV